ncbi:hypothetical protein GCM10020221_03720 [Streptomyces thioluteus]|uniref:HTH cro/C1-type domain-containing protein n=2 Tax=Streptomyces thioluteus TaxID=66431 RepID=A0ABN3WDC7_STRTU
MPSPKRLDPARSRAERLGALIRELRLRKGWTQAELGRAVALSNSAISKYETGEKVPPRDVVESLDKALGANGRLIEEREQLDDNPDAKWVQKYIRCESTAIRIRQLSGLMPALLQNEEYTRIILEQNLPLYGGDLGEKLDYRARRRAILGGTDAPHFSVVVGEAAFHTVIGDAGVMRRQLLDLVEASTKPNIDVRVVPFNGAGRANELGNTAVFDFRDGSSLVYRAGIPGGFFIASPGHVKQYAEFYDRFHADALGEEASRMLVRKVIEEKYPCRQPSTCL